MTAATVCLCGAAGCNTPDAIAERQRRAAEAEAERVLNLRAFEAYYADHKAGNPLKSPADYRAEAGEQA